MLTLHSRITTCKEWLLRPLYALIERQSPDRIYPPGRHLNDIRLHDFGLQSRYAPILVFGFGRTALRFARESPHRLEELSS